LFPDPTSSFFFPLPFASISLGGISTLLSGDFISRFLLFAFAFHEALHVPVPEFQASFRVEDGRLVNGLFLLAIVGSASKIDRWTIAVHYRNTTLPLLVTFSMFH
jgi:hypothetical protein